MLSYNLRLAWKSVRRHPVLSSLIVLGIALGVGVATTFITIYHVLARDPLPGKSDKIHYVRVNNWQGLTPATEEGPPPKLAYRDMMSLMKSDIPARQTATAAAQLVVRPEKGERPFRGRIRLAMSDFFPMFDVPFLYGSGWDRQADGKPEAVAVISAALNDRLFGGENSVGRKLRVEDREFRILGVIDHWQPPVRYYDIVDNPVGVEVEDVFLPFQWVGPMEIRNTGMSMSGGNEGNYENFIDGLNASERNWVQLWVELPDEARRKEYESFVAAYIAEQHKAGRFPRWQDYLVTSMLAFMEEREVVPPQARALALISLLFLTVAAVNLIGLFLGKFLAKASVVGVRRALGASRRAIFLQHLVEAELVALIGGVAGLGLAVVTMALINRGVEDVPPLHINGLMVLAAVGLSLAAGAIAGVYPAWRICAIPPARHLKNQ
jgi:putative ABC transport system permease protein